eukprot:UN3524
MNGSGYQCARRAGSYAVCSEVNTAIKLVVRKSGLRLPVLLYWYGDVEEWSRGRLRAMNLEVGAKLNAEFCFASDLKRKTEAFFSGRQPFGLLITFSDGVSIFESDVPGHRNESHHLTIVKLESRFRIVHSFRGLYSLESWLRESDWLTEDEMRQQWSLWCLICMAKDSAKAVAAGTRFLHRPCRPCCISPSALKDRGIGVHLVTDLTLLQFLETFEALLERMRIVACI